MVFYYITHEVRVLGNPSQNQFNIVVNSSSDEKIRIRVVHVSGRVLDVKENLMTGQTIKIGEKYRVGAYFAEVRQGNKTKTVKLIKL